MIFIINFTRRVLGPKATKRLLRKEVTQTLWSIPATTGTVLSAQWPKPGDRVEIRLNNKAIGAAEFIIADRVSWDDIDTDDARRGGFDNLEELHAALMRTGYRFFRNRKDLKLQRVQFSWLEEADIDSKEAD